LDNAFTNNSDNASDDGVTYNLNRVQSLLNDLKGLLDLPVNFKPRSLERDGGIKSQTNKIMRNEEYYLEHNSMEIVSLLVKYIVEILIKLNVVESVETIPHSISRILYLASNKSDLALETELYNQFFIESNKIIIDEINHYKSQVGLTNVVNDLKLLHKVNQKEANVSNIDDSGSD
jgi:nucleoside diphosphate kinase